MKVKGFNIGDRVASNGPHAEMVAVNQNLCVLVPGNVKDEEAAFTVITSIALQGIRQASPMLGENICVIGLGLLGQLTSLMLKSNGVHRVLKLSNPKKK